MRTHKTLISALCLWLLAGGVAFAAGDAQAKVTKCDAAKNEKALALPQRLSSLIAKNCFLLDAYVPEDLRQTRDVLKASGNDEKRALHVVDKLTAEISDEVEARSGLEANFFPELLQRALRVRMAIPAERYLLWQEWELKGNGSVGDDSGLEIDPFLVMCPNDPAEATWDQNDCSIRYQTARDVLVRTRLMERALRLASRPALVAAAKANQLALKRWDAYFNDTRTQYLWELGISEWRLNKTKNDGRPDAGGVKLGFRKVPTNQVIFLHPGVAFEYLDDAADGSQFEETAILEVLGYNSWKWDGSDPKKAWGLSLTAAWTDREASDDFGVGLMLHFAHRYSIGVTDHDGDVGVLVSADVSKLWLKVKESRKKRMRGDE